MKLPAEFAENGYLAKIYLRTYAFNYCEVTYDFEQYKAFEPAEDNKHKFRYETRYPGIPEPYDVNITDSSYKDYYETSCLPLPKVGTVVEIDDTEVADAGSVEQAIFEKLQLELDVDFVFEY